MLVRPHQHHRGLQLGGLDELVDGAGAAGPREDHRVQLARVAAVPDNVARLVPAAVQL